MAKSPKKLGPLKGRAVLQCESLGFELAPVALWLADYSDLYGLFMTWREDGVVSLRDHLRESPKRLKTCSDRIRVIDVNRKLLKLFEAKDFAHLSHNLDRVFGGLIGTAIDELEYLWNGALEFTGITVNYTLGGARLDIRRSGVLLSEDPTDWSRVLIAMDDVTERETASRKVVTSENYARGLFENSPVSLWVEDFSTIKRSLDDVRDLGITDFRTFTDLHPEFVKRCMSEIRVLDVNQHTLDLFGAPDKPTLVKRLGEIFRDNMRDPFREQLVDLWNGKLFQQREVINYALDGTELHVHLQLSILPGHESDWSLVQVGLTDISARKKAEAYMEFLGKHDALTKLYNRSFYNDEINRIERKRPYPISVIVVDLNGLKAANDRSGHASGDDLLRRAGEVLSEATAGKQCSVARIGGDEFAILMPSGDESNARDLMDDVEDLVEANNKFYPGLPLSLSLGAATGMPGEQTEAIIHRADAQMYEAKRRFYRESGQNRRFLTECALHQESVDQLVDRDG